MAVSDLTPRAHPYLPGLLPRRQRGIAHLKKQFRHSSVRSEMNHRKIATVEAASGLKFLRRGSINFDFNPRFEQFDITEGGPEFDLVIAGNNVTGFIFTGRLETEIAWRSVWASMGIARQERRIGQKLGQRRCGGNAR
jgi:hypothetical protein